MKVALARAEVNELYLAVTKDAVNHLMDTLTIDQVNFYSRRRSCVLIRLASPQRPCEDVHKEVHTIGDRKFAYVEIGQVDHNAVKVKTAIKDTQSMHTMAQKAVMSLGSFVPAFIITPTLLRRLTAMISRSSMATSHAFACLACVSVAAELLIVLVSVGRSLMMSLVMSLVLSLTPPRCVVWCCH